MMYTMLDKTVCERYCFLPRIIPPYLNLKLSSRLRRNEIIHSEFYNNKIIYTHIPKAAGSSIGKAILGHDRVGHYPLRYISRIDKPFFDEAFKFTFVRNPFNRLISAYYFLTDGGKGEWDKGWIERNNLKGVSFRDFVLGYLDEKVIYSIIHLVPQYEFLVNENGVIVADFIGKLESIEKDLIAIKSLCGMDLSVKKLNATKSNYDLASYDQEMRNKVNVLYRKDFELFLYSDL